MSLGDTLHSSISREKIQQTVRFGVLGWGCGFFGMVVFWVFSVFWFCCLLVFLSLLLLFLSKDCFFAAWEHKTRHMSTDEMLKNKS